MQKNWTNIEFLLVRKSLRIQQGSWFVIAIWMITATCRNDVCNRADEVFFFKRFRTRLQIFTKIHAIDSSRRTQSDDSIRRVRFWTQSDEPTTWSDESPQRSEFGIRRDPSDYLNRISNWKPTGSQLEPTGSSFKLICPLCQSWGG